MGKRLLIILSKISENLKDLEFDPEDILEMVQCDELDLQHIIEDLEEVKDSENLSEDALDILKALLVYILIREDAYDEEDVYSLIFGGGKKILWN